MLTNHLDYIIAIVALVIMSGFFSGAETSLIGSSSARIHKLAEKGFKRANLVLKLKKRKDSIITTILLGNNIVNILASAIATNLAIKTFGDEGIAIATVSMTFIILIFGEILPKTYACYYTESLAIFVSPLISLLEFVFKPLIILLQFIVSFFLKIIRLFHKDSGHHSLQAADVIRGEIDLQHKAGLVVKLDKDMLDSIFDIKEMEVRQIMIHRRQMFMLDASLPITELFNKVLESGFSRVPIYQNEEDNIIGILSSKSVITALKNNTENINKFNLNKIMHDPWFIPDSTKVSKQLDEFRQKRNHIAIVVDEYGALQGIITLADIVEEIVGSVKDEHDTSQEYNVISDNNIIVSGTMTIRDLNREFDWDIEDDGATTIAGLLIKKLGFIPDVGYSYEINNMKFVVLNKDKQQISKIKIIKDNNEKK